MEIYFDNAATTQPYPAVRETVMQMMDADYGNPSSMHMKGVESERFVRGATETLAGLLRVKPKEIFYTSGGTESNNWALFGTADRQKRKGRHIIISAIEHAAVSAPAKVLEKQGFEVTRLGTDAFGRVDPEELRAAMRDDTILVSVMFVNNEIGTIEPIAELGRVIHACNSDTLFHVDAVQAFGKLPIYPKQLQIDMMSVSAHKIHGPKGAGFLYVGEKARINPLIYGGGQQNDMRSGTDNVPGIAGMARAAEEIYSRMDANKEHLSALKSRLRDGLAEMEDVVIHADLPETAPHILNASFLGIRSEVLLHTLEDAGIYVSAGSACSSHKRAGSATLTAIGCSKEEMESAVRFSFSGLNTIEEVDIALDVLHKVVPQLRRFRRR